jgi:sugar phosphate permease
MGITAFGLPIAGILLPPLIADVMPSIGWRAVWRIAGLITAFVVLPLVLWVVRDRPGERDGTFYLAADGAAGAHRGHGHGHAHGGASSLRWADILKRRNYWLLVICYLPIVALYGGVQQNLAPIIASHGLDPKTAGVLLPIFSVAGVIGTLAMGIISDRYGNRLALAGLAFLAAVGGVLVGYSSSLPALAVASAIVGFTSGLWTLLPAAIALEFGAAGVGRAFGALMLFLPINAIVPSLMAKIRESTGSYAPAMIGLGVITVVAGCLVLLMREKRGGHLTAAEKEAALEDAPITQVP